MDRAIRFRFGVLASALACAMCCAILRSSAQEAGKSGLSDDRSAGKVLDCEGSVHVKPASGDRWTSAAAEMIVLPSDLIKTGARGANAASISLKSGASIVLGPGAIAEIPDSKSARIIEGEMEAVSPVGSEITVTGPGGASMKFRGSRCVRASGGKLSVLDPPPRWLTDYKKNQSTEAMGSLLANIDGREVPLSIGYHKVVVDVRDQIARTVVEESFVNHTSTVLEGVFYFPLPQDASISGFGMWIGNELVEADVVEKERAREIYETILREKRDPGLLEWTGGNIFKARVYPITSEKRIKITYTQVLPRKNGVYRYSYALKSEMLRLTPLKKLSVDFKLWSADPLLSVSCPTHECRIDSGANSARVEFEAEEYVPSRDFEVAVETASRGGDATLVRHVRDTEGYFMLLLNAPRPEKAGARQEVRGGKPLDFIVMADTSGSMRGDPGDRQIRFVESLLESLGEADRFNVMTVDVAPRWAFDAPQAPGTESRRKALAFVESRGALGWTDLDRAFAQVADRAGESTHVVYVGDGIVTTGDADPQAFGRRLSALYKGRGTFHAVATGSSFESSVLRAISGLGMGSVRVLDEETPPAMAAFELLMEITSPSVKDIKVEFTGMATAAVYPETLPNLPEGAQQILIGRFRPGSDPAACRVKVKGSLGGKPVEFQASMAPTDSGADSSFVPRLWARMHLDNLLSQGQSQEVKNRIITLSEDYNIITPYTSLLVLESDEDRARFSVKKRMRMRDAEEFFVEGRENAEFELKRKQILKAAQWRRNLRAEVLAGLEDMDRSLMQQLSGLDESWTTEELSIGDAPGGGIGGKYGARLAGRALYPAEKKSRNGGGEDEEMAKGGDDWGPAAAPSSSPTPTPKPGEPVFAEDDGGEGEPSMEEEPESDHNETEDSELKEMDKSVAKDQKQGFIAGKALRRSREDVGRFKDSLAGETGYISRRRPAPPRPDFGNWLFPAMPAKPGERVVPKWSGEMLDLVNSLDRRPSVAALAGGLHAALDSEQFDRRGNLAARGEAEYLLSGSSWAVRHPHAPGHSYLVDWCSGGERGCLTADWLLGRIRKAGDSDAQSWPDPVSWFFGGSFLNMDPERTELAKLDEGKAEVRFKNPDGSLSVVIVVDLSRKVVVEQRNMADGKVASTVSFGGFAEVSNMILPGEIATADDKGKTTSRTKISWKSLARDEFDALAAAVLSKKAEAILLGEQPAKIDDCRQADKEGRATVEDYMLLALDAASRQDWDAADKPVAALLKAVSGRWGSEIMKIELLQQRRRLEELKTLALDISSRLASSPRDGEQSCAARMLYAAYHLSPGERLSMLEKLKPVYMRRDPAEPTMLAWDQEALNCLWQMNRPDDALAKCAEMAASHPYSAYVQTTFADALRQRGETDRALAHLAGIEKKSGPWDEYETQTIRQAAADILGSAHRLEEMVEYIEAWERGMPDGVPVHILNRLLSALTLLDREPKARELAARWIEAAKKDEPSPGDSNRLEAAVQFVSGSGWYIWFDRLESSELDVLAATAAWFAGHKTLSRVAGGIMTNYRFYYSDQAKKLWREIFVRMTAEVRSMPPQRILESCSWLLGSRPEDASKAEWDAFYAAVLARWEAAKTEEEKAPLARIIENWAVREVKLAYLRKSCAAAQAGAHRIAAAMRLFDMLMAEKWSEDAKKEILGLVPEIAKKPEGEAANLEIDRAAHAMFQFASWAASARAAAAVEALKDVNLMPRRVLAAERKKAVQQALAETASMLAAMEDGFEPAFLRPWIALDAVYFKARNRAEVPALRLRAAGLLETAAAAAPAAEPEPPVRDEVFAQRCVATLIRLALLEPGSAEASAALLADFNRRISAGQKAADWQGAIFRLLTALDRADEIEKVLAAWYSGGGKFADVRWGRCLAYILAERAKIKESVGIFAEIAEKDLLGHEDFRMLADLHHALGDRAACDAAKIRSWSVLEEWSISNRLSNMYYSKYSRHGEEIPSELDPEVPIMFSALFRKSSYPPNHSWILANYYQGTRDFRILECIPEAVIGHSSQGIYAFLEGLGGLFQSIGEEAVVDRLVKNLAEVRRTARTDIDRRALLLLEFMAEHRAGSLPTGARPHGESALAALRQAFLLSWADGEPELMSGFLSQRGAESHKSILEEQYRQLKALALMPAEGSFGRLVTGLHLAKFEWDMNTHGAAILTLSAALGEYRTACGGLLANQANDALATLSGYYQAEGYFMDAEKLMKSELALGHNPQQKTWLKTMLHSVYRDAFDHDSEVSIGKGDRLYVSLRDLFMKELDIRTDEYTAGNTVEVLCHVFQVGAQRAYAGAGSDVSDFAFKKLPAVLRIYNHRGGQNMIYYVDDCVQKVLGHKTALVFLITRAENEPSWLARTGQEFWGQHSWRLADHRSNAGSLDQETERRLLSVVMDEVRRDLRTRVARNRVMYSVRTDHFWTEKAGEFLKAALEAAAAASSSEHGMLYACSYLFHDLNRKAEALQVLRDALARNALGFQGKLEFARYLHTAGVFEESIPVLEGLVPAEPDRLEIRTMLMTAFFKTGRKDALRKTLKDADAHFHGKNLWNEEVIAGLGFACTETRLMEEAIPYLREALALHVKSAPNRGVGDGVLSRYYGTMADALAGLGRTAEAVDAAAGAIVSWPPNNESRRNELDRLRRILAAASDLDAYIALLDAETAKTGLENPVVRKAAGEVYLRSGRNQKAEVQLKTAAESRPGDVETHKLLVEALDAQGKRVEAAERLLILSELTPHDFQLFADLAERMRIIERPEEGERACTNLVEASPHESEGHAALAAIRENQGRWAEAAEQWRGVTRVRSGEPEGWMSLARALHRAGDSDGAVKILEHVIETKWDKRFGDVGSKARGILRTIGSGRKGH